MIQMNCGCLPVVEDEQYRKLMGMITDQDMVGRAVGQGLNPLQLTAVDCMSYPPVVITPLTRLVDCYQVMATYQLRRIPVADEQYHCIGIITQADIARHAPHQTTAWLVQQLSRSMGQVST